MRQAKNGAGSVKQDFRESQKFMLVQAITANRDTHGCVVSSTQPRLKLWRSLQVWLEILKPPKRSSQLIGGFGQARLTTTNPSCGGRHRG